VGSIRWRILKDIVEGCIRHLKAVVTVGSIRWRILKEMGASSSNPSRMRYSGLDPMEDTESLPASPSTASCRPVTVGSIRWRILKVILHDDGANLPEVTVGSIRWRILKV